MDHLPEDIFSTFLSYLSPQDRQNYMLSLNGTMITSYPHTVRRNKTMIREFIRENFHEAIIGLMGGMGKMMSYPAMEWKDKYLGNTSYIEFDRLDKSTDRISWGVDCFGRAFVVLRAIWGRYTRSNWPTASVLFQRHKEAKGRWSSSCSFLQASGHFLREGRFSDSARESLVPSVTQIVNSKSNVCELTWVDVFRQPDGGWAVKSVKHPIILP